jgi:large subunit ribosomal protein L31
MKNDIHPKFYTDAKVTCACGNTFTTGSTLKEIKVEVCSECHPFFTGKMRYVDTLGKVDKFNKKMAKAKQYQKQQAKKKKKQDDTKEKEQKQPQTLKEMLQQAKE